VPDHAVDEPLAFSAGGKCIYWNLCCDREAGAVDITIPYNQGSRAWGYWGYSLRSICPGYQPGYFMNDMDGWGVFGRNGTYGKHGTAQNPFVPYNNRLYTQKGNCVMAFSTSGGASGALPMAMTVPVQDTQPAVTVARLKQKLEAEVQKMVSAGHLRPGYYSTGWFEYTAGNIAPGLGDYLEDPFHNPSDTICTLIRALPHLSTSLQQQTSSYIKSEFNSYPLYTYCHIGWASGAAREVCIIPPDDTSRHSGPRLQAGEATRHTGNPSRPIHSMAHGNTFSFFRAQQGQCSTT